MSRLLWCAQCSSEKQEGTRRIYEGGVRDEDESGSYMEPDEYERCVFGRAKLPNPEDRFMMINGTPYPMPTEFFICDHCGAAIPPDAKCMCWTVWSAVQVEPEPWEDDFLVRTP